MKETRYAYAAGLIDADGSLYISKSTLGNGYVSYDPTLMLRSTHLPTIKWFVSKFGGTYSKSTWENGEHKDYYRWKFSSDKHASRFLDKITPYLWLKKDQAIVLKNYFDLEGAIAPEEREKLRLKISDLNHNSSLTTNTPSLPLNNKLRHSYLAGMFDGEGSFYILKVSQSQQSRGKGFYYRSCVEIGNTVENLIKEVKSTYGGNIRTRPPHNGNYPMHYWDIKDNKGKEKFILAILPYLVTKKEQANIVLNFSRMAGVVNPDARKKMWSRCSILNGKMIESDLNSNIQSDLTVTLES